MAKKKKKRPVRLATDNPDYKPKFQLLMSPPVPVLMSYMVDGATGLITPLSSGGQSAIASGDAPLSPDRVNSRLNSSRIQQKVPLPDAPRILQCPEKGCGFESTPKLLEHHRARWHTRKAQPAGSFANKHRQTAQDTVECETCWKQIPKSGIREHRRNHAEQKLRSLRKHGMQCDCGRKLSPEDLKKHWKAEHRGAIPPQRLRVLAAKLNRKLNRLMTQVGETSTLKNTRQSKVGQAPTSTLASSNPFARDPIDHTRPYAHPYRENGMFGSHPSHDGFDDESCP